MNQLARFTCLLAILTLTSACIPPRVPTQTPTSVPSPTATPHPAATPLPCPPGYSRHIDAQMGFSVCYPTGWVITKHEDLDNALTRVDFTMPMPDTDTRPRLRFIAVSVSPRPTGISDEEFLQEVSKWLILEYHQKLLARPETIVLNDHKAVDAGYEARVAFGREVVDVTRWVTVLLTDEHQWVIEVSGRSEYRNELEEIRSQFLPHFYLLPV